MNKLFCDCRTDEEKSLFFLSGRAVETGIIAPAVSNDVAMAYSRCAEFKKELDALRAKIEAMEKQEPAGTLHDDGYFVWRRGFRPYESNHVGCMMKLYALPGAQAQPAPSVPEGWKLVPIEPTREMVLACASAARAYTAEYGGNSPQVMWAAMLAAAPKPEVK